MRLIFRDSIGSLLFNRYQHERHGVVETLTQQSVVYVRPVFGLLKPDEPQQTGVAESRTQEPKPKRARRLSFMRKDRSAAQRAKRSVGGEA